MDGIDAGKGASPAPRTPILGVGVSAVSLASARDVIIGWIESHRASGGPARYVAVTGVHGVMEAQDDPAFKRILNESGLTVPDGMPLVWLSRLAGRSEVTRVYGPDLTLAVSRALGERGGSAFYYGAAPGVAEQLAAELRRRCPGLRTAGCWSPPYRPLTPAEEDAIVERINATNADIVWVGLSTPRQERWMARFQGRLHAPALIGVGAAFDFLTGQLRQAPRWMQRSGLEWLFRMFVEPRRLARRYLRNNPRFLWCLACEKLGLRRFDLPSGS